MEHKLSDQDLLKIQKEMKKVIQANHKLERFELPREEAIKYMADRNEDYKVELIQDLPEDAIISFYKQGDFVDLCAGPHMESTGQIKAVKMRSFGELPATGIITKITCILQKLTTRTMPSNR